MHLILYNSGTTPVDTTVIDAMLPYFRDSWGNPSSSHYYGRAAKEGLALARKQIADLIGCSADEIFFTSGGTESNNWALKGAVYASRRSLQVYIGVHISMLAAVSGSVVECILNTHLLI